MIPPSPFRERPHFSGSETTHPTQLKRVKTPFLPPRTTRPRVLALLPLCGVREYPDFLQLVRFLPISSSVQDIPQVLVFSSLV